MRLSSLLLCILLTLSAPHASAAAGAAKPAAKSATSFFRGTPLPAWAAPLAAPPPTTRRDPVVIRLAETQAWAGSNPAVLVSRAIQVNDKSRLGEIGQYGLTYFPAYQKLHLHRVAILRGEQTIERTATAQTRLLEREPSLESGFYVGETTVQLLLEDIRVGDTLLITYSTEGVNPVFGKVWADDFSWDNLRPIELRRLTISHPASRPLAWRELGDVAPRGLAPVVERAGDVERLRFEARAIAAIEPEPGTPPDFLPVTMIQTSEYASWHEVALWAAGLFGAPPASPAVATLARQFAGGASEEARASAALHWVQDEIRYFSVALGENSHRPQAPDEVLRRRFGDCKDKSNLLIAILARNGIRAEPVLVSARAPGMPAKLLPSPSWFDHVIVRVHADDKTFYVDPTREGEKGLLSQLTTAIPGAAGLVVAASTTALLTLPDEAPELVRFEQNEKFIVDKLDGDATLDVRNVFRGSYARFARLRYAAMTPSELRNAVLGDYEKLFGVVALVGEPTVEDSADGTSVTVGARLTLPKPVVKADGMVAISHKATIFDGALELPAKLARKLPFALPYGAYRARYHLQIIWPEELKFGDIDNAETVDNAVFRAHKEYAWRGNEVDYQVDFAVKKKQLAAGELVELAAQSKLINSYIESSLKFPEQAVVKPAAVMLSVRDARVPQMLVSARSVNDLLRDQAAGKGAALTTSQLCQSALDMMYVEQAYPSTHYLTGPILKEMMARKAPQDQADTRLCKGLVNFQEADFAGAVARWSAPADAKDADEASPVPLDLAWARLATGDTAGAVAGTSRFIDTALASGDLHSADAAFAVALLQRAGAALPAGLLAYAKGAESDVWPRPILAFQTGALDAAQLLAVVARFGVVKREYALNEAWFYIGARRLHEGDTAGAIDAWRWYSGNALLGSRTASVALAELARLETADPDYQKGRAAEDAASPDYATAKRFYLAAAARGVAAAEYSLGWLAEYGKVATADPAEAFRWYLLGAEHGDLNAMNSVAIVYDKGIAVAKDQAKAIAWFARAARSGHRHASRNLGWRYLHGSDGVEVDYAAALRHLRMAAELGNPEAQGMISKMYFRAQGTSKDLTSAVYWAARASELDDVEGTTQMAFLLAYGHGIDADPKRAIALWTVAAGRGSGDAQVQLGNAYQRGRGVERDLAKALAWFLKAAANGNYYATEQTARAYIFGFGADKDAGKAQQYLDVLGKQNKQRALYWQAEMVAYGTGGAPNQALAVTYYRQCAELGDVDCQRELALALQFGRAGAVDLQEAATWYAKAAEQEDNPSINNLADMYEKGIGVAQDLPRAVRMYRQAALDGHPISLYSLGELYELGTGVKADAYLSFTFYQLASDHDFKKAPAARDRLAAQLSTEQLARARAFAKAWKPQQALPDAANML